MPFKINKYFFAVSFVIIIVTIFWGFPVPESVNKITVEKPTVVTNLIKKAYAGKKKLKCFVVHNKLLGPHDSGQTFVFLLVSKKAILS